MTLQHSRPSNLLGMKQTYDDANEMDCGTAGCKHEWYEEISNDLKNILIKSQHSNTRPIFNVRCSTHSWFTQLSFRTNSSTSSVCRIRLNTAVTAEMKMLCHSVEGNSRSHYESIFGMCFLLDGVETHPVPYRSVGVIVFLCVAGPDSSTVHEKYKFHNCIFAFTTEMNGKITTELELEDEPQESSMTVCVKTINGKTISIK